MDNESYQGCPLPEQEIRAHVPVKDTQARVSEWVSDWDQSIPSHLNSYSNEVEWNEELPTHGSVELVIPNQYSNEVEWDEELPSHGSMQLAIPSQYSNEVDWDEQLPSHGLQEEQPSQNPWNEELPRQVSGGLPRQNSWDAVLQSSGSKEFPIQNSWDEETPSHGLNELPSKNSFEEETQSRSPDKSRCKEKLPSLYSNRKKIEGQCIGERRRGEKKEGTRKPIYDRKAQPVKPGLRSVKPIWQESKPRWC